MKTFLFLLTLLACPCLHAAERPNILWVVSEDNSSQWIGCYGNDQARTPRIDALAKQGILFENAYSNGAVCAVARATLVNGAYSPTMGTQHMRSRHAIPAKYRSYPEYLRSAGYYCTNSAKTDYNFKGNDKAIWDDCSPRAHYKNRPKGAPFFAVFNVEVTHESSLFNGRSMESKRLKPQQIKLPPYVPDLPEMRKDFARYHDRITAMDGRVGKLIDELEAQGLADDTIVIYNSDHGGATPRGKRYLYQTGVKVPLVIRIPEKWKSLCKFQPGQRVDEPVSFVDFGPTFLSLAGIETPPQMQGRALLGSKRVESAADEMEFLYGDRFDELFRMHRGLTDGKWKYIRSFSPQLAGAPYSSYQFGQPSWRAWKAAWKSGKLSGVAKTIWESPEPTERLYDLSKDPWEVENLANNSAHAEKLASMRERLKSTMKEATDTGLIPEPLFGYVAGTATVADYAQSDRFPIDRVLKLAFTASDRKPAGIPVLQKALASENPVERYWAVSGLMMMGETAAPAADAILPLLKDEHSVIRAVAGEALWEAGRREVAKEALIGEITKEKDSSSLLYLFNILRRLDLLDEVPVGWEKGTTGDNSNVVYIRDLLKQAAKEKVE